MSQLNTGALAGRSRIPRVLSRLVRRALNRMALGTNVVCTGGLRAGLGARISAPHHLSLGRWVAVGPNTTIEVDGLIGDFVLIGRNVQIIGRDDHALHEIGQPISLATWVGDREPRDRDRITIGTDVWIGASATVLSGIKVGDGAVIAAGALVTKDVEPFCIVGGVPARALGMRFTTDEQRSEHLRILAGHLKGYK